VGDIGWIGGCGVSSAIVWVSSLQILDPSLERQAVVDHVEDTSPSFDVEPLGAWSKASRRRKGLQGFSAG
jgi:hypothetical protein